MRIMYSLIAMGGLIAGCAPAGENTRLEMQAWIGKDSSELLASWGNPDEVQNLADGTTQLSWIDEETFTTPVSTRNSEAGALPQVIVTGGQVVTMECKKHFIVGRDGKIVSADVHGNLCR